MMDQQLRAIDSPDATTGTPSPVCSVHATRSDLICVVLPDLRGGGAERLHVNLANDWVGRGLRVQFALMRNRGDLHCALDPRIGIHDLGVSRFRSLVLPLARYLRRVRPSGTLAAIWPLTSITIAAWRIAGRPRSGG